MARRASDAAWAFNTQDDDARDETAPNTLENAEDLLVTMRNARAYAATPGLEGPLLSAETHRGEEALDSGALLAGSTPANTPQTLTASPARSVSSARLSSPGNASAKERKKKTVTEHVVPSSSAHLTSEEGMQKLFLMSAPALETSEPSSASLRAETAASRAAAAATDTKGEDDGSSSADMAAVTLSTPLRELVRGAALREDADAPLLNIPEDFTRRTAAGAARGEATRMEGSGSRPYTGSHRSDATIRPVCTRNTAATEAAMRTADITSLLEATRAVAATLMVDPDAPRPSRAHMLKQITHATTTTTVAATAAPPAPSTAATAAKKPAETSTKRRRETARKDITTRPTATVEGDELRLFPPSPFAPSRNDAAASQVDANAVTSSSPASALQAESAAVSVVASHTPTAAPPVAPRSASRMRSLTLAVANSLLSAGASAAAVSSDGTAVTSLPPPVPPQHAHVKQAPSNSSTGSRQSGGTPSFFTPHSPLSPSLAWPPERSFAPFSSGSPLEATNNSLIRGQDSPERRPSTSSRLPVQQPQQHYASLSHMDRDRPIPRTASALSSGERTDAPLHFEDLLDGNTVTSFDEEMAREYAAEAATEGNDEEDEEDEEYDALREEGSVRERIRRRGSNARRNLSISSRGSRLARSRGGGGHLVPVAPPSDLPHDSLHSAEMPDFSFESGDAAVSSAATAAAAALIAAWRVRSLQSGRSSTPSQPGTVDSASTSTSSQPLQLLAAAGSTTPIGSAVMMVGSGCGGGSASLSPLWGRTSESAAAATAAPLPRPLREEGQRLLARAAEQQRPPSGLHAFRPPAPPHGTKAGEKGDGSSSRHPPPPPPPPGGRSAFCREIRDVLDSSLSAPEMPEVLPSATPRSATEPTSCIATASNTPVTMLSRTVGGGGAAGRRGGGQSGVKDVEHLLPSSAASHLLQQQATPLVSASTLAAAVPATTHPSTARAQSGTAPTSASPLLHVGCRPPRTGPWATGKVVRPPPLLLTQRSSASSTVRTVSGAESPHAENSPEVPQHDSDTATRMSATAALPNNPSSTAPPTHGAGHPRPEHSVEQSLLASSGDSAVEVTTTATADATAAAAAAEVKVKPPRALFASSLTRPSPDTVFIPEGRPLGDGMVQPSSSGLCDTGLVSPSTAVENGGESQLLEDSLPSRSSEGAEELSLLSPSSRLSAPTSLLDRQDVLTSPVSVTTTASPSSVLPSMVVPLAPLKTHDGAGRHKAKETSAAAHLTRSSSAVCERASHASLPRSRSADDALAGQTFELAVAAAQPATGRDGVPPDAVGAKAVKVASSAEVGETTSSENDKGNNAKTRSSKRHFRLLWILLPYGVFVAMLAVGMFVATHVVAQETVSHTWSELHTYMRDELVAFMEEVTLLPVMSGEMLTSQRTRNAAHPRPTDPRRPPIVNVSRGLCAALKYTDLGKLMVTLTYVSLSSADATNNTAGGAATLQPHARRTELEGDADPKELTLRTRRSETDGSGSDAGASEVEWRTAFAFCDASYSADYFLAGAREAVRARQRDEGELNKAADFYSINMLTMDVVQPPVKMRIARSPPHFDGNAAARVAHVLPIVQAWKAAVERNDGSESSVERWLISSPGPLASPHLTYVHPFYEYGRAEPSAVWCRMKAAALLRSYVKHQQLQHAHSPSSITAKVMLLVPRRQQPPPQLGGVRDRVLRGVSDAPITEADIIARSWALDTGREVRRSSGASPVTPTHTTDPSPNTTPAAPPRALDECAENITDRGHAPAALSSELRSLRCEGEDAEHTATSSLSAAAADGADGGVSDHPGWLPWLVHDASPLAGPRLDDVGDALMQAALGVVNVSAYAAEMYERRGAPFSPGTAVASDVPPHTTARHSEGGSLQGAGQRTVMPAVFREFYFAGQRAAVSVAAVQLQSNFSVMMVVVTPLSAAEGGRCETMQRYLTVIAVAVAVMCSTFLVFFVLTCYVQLPLISIQQELEQMVVLHKRKAAAPPLSLTADEVVNVSPLSLSGVAKQDAAMAESASKSGEGRQNEEGGVEKTKDHRAAAESNDTRVVEERVRNTAALPAEDPARRQPALDRAMTESSGVYGPERTISSFPRRLRLRLLPYAHRLLHCLTQLRLSEMAELQDVSAALRQHVHEIQQYIPTRYTFDDSATALLPSSSSPLTGKSSNATTTTTTTTMTAAAVGNTAHPRSSPTLPTLAGRTRAAPRSAAATAPSRRSLSPPVHAQPEPELFRSSSAAPADQAIAVNAKDSRTDSSSNDGSGGGVSGGSALDSRLSATVRIAETHGRLGILGDFSQSYTLLHPQVSVGGSGTVPAARSTAGEPPPSAKSVSHPRGYSEGSNTTQTHERRLQADSSTTTENTNAAVTLRSSRSTARASHSTGSSLDHTTQEREATQPDAAAASMAALYEQSVPTACGNSHAGPPSDPVDVPHAAAHGKERPQEKPCLAPSPTPAEEEGTREHGGTESATRERVGPSASANTDDSHRKKSSGNNLPRPPMVQLPNVLSTSSPPQALLSVTTPDVSATNSETENATSIPASSHLSAVEEQAAESSDYHDPAAYHVSSPHIKRDARTWTPNSFSKCLCSLLCIHVHIEDNTDVHAQFPEIVETVMECVYRYGGIFDVLVPEMMYVSFGSRVQTKDHALLATRCGIEIFSRLSTRALRYMTFVVDTGVYTVGVCGVPEHKEFVLFGRPSSEIFFEQQLQSGFRFLVTDSAVPLIRQHFRMLPIDVMTVVEETGQPNIVLYVVMVGSVHEPWWEDFSQLAHEAFLNFIRGNFEAACPLYERLLHSSSVTLTILFQYLLVHERVLTENKAGLSPTELARQLDELTVTCVNELSRERDPMVEPFGAAMPWLVCRPELHRHFSDEDGDDEAPKSITSATSSSGNGTARRRRGRRVFASLTSPMRAGASATQQRLRQSRAAGLTTATTSSVSMVSPSTRGPSTFASLCERTPTTSKSGRSVSATTATESSVAEAAMAAPVAPATDTSVESATQRRNRSLYKKDSKVEDCVDDEMVKVALGDGEDDDRIVGPKADFNGIALRVLDLSKQLWQLSNTPIGGAAAVARIDTSLSFVGISSNGAMAEIQVYAVKVAPQTVSTWSCPSLLPPRPGGVQGGECTLQSTSVSPPAAEAPTTTAAAGDGARKASTDAVPASAVVSLREKESLHRIAFALPSQVRARQEDAPHAASPFSSPNSPDRGDCPRRAREEMDGDEAGEGEESRQSAAASAALRSRSADLSLTAGTNEAQQVESDTTDPTEPAARGGGGGGGEKGEEAHSTSVNVDLAAMDAVARCYCEGNTVQLLSMAVTPTHVYTIMEWVAEQTLRKTVSRFGSRLALASTRKCCVAALRALDHLHNSRGVVHGRVHPDNILFGVEGNCKITGMLYLYEWALPDPALYATLTRVAAAYCSPEVNAGEAPTPESDIYSFGLLLLQMLAGELPWTWTGTTPQQPQQPQQQRSDTSGPELRWILQDNKTFIEAVNGGEIELRQYGRERNQYNVSMEAALRRQLDHVGWPRKTAATTARRKATAGPNKGSLGREEQATDPVMLRVLESCLAYEPSQRKGAAELLKLLCEM
ncbi:hypothetical protein ABB37_09047 [Leptomonas pyrrhocoris]|uniref:Protein kinase domain-containing protein n=1 Tax=Leptomonas pyrrhocoris TaxID=157538 RepID=A0A0N0VD59_LEPPY|nr:hypothetical protein ABB37_09047 [Leptomonas pyrrhocoris]KPA74752.1 hypothetical protein ABB37_09047 [Leptomonas pyrrhocoris]|eukprot:XP_015653191.1 hypothetical protein ABB37_09047 [Leptomonas pyrrhocoris]